MHKTMEVVTATGAALVITADEQGRLFRSITQLIYHAANRHASSNGGRFYLGSGA